MERRKGDGGMEGLRDRGVMEERKGREMEEQRRNRGLRDRGVERLRRRGGVVKGWMGWWGWGMERWRRGGEFHGGTEEGWSRVVVGEKKRGI